MKKNGLTPKEYFLMTGNSLEYAIFLERVIKPYVNVTERDVKNEHYRTHYYKDMGDSWYGLIEFIVKKEHISRYGGTAVQRELNDIVSRYLAFGRIPLDVSTNIQASHLDNVVDTNYTQKLKFFLRKTDEGSLSTFLCDQENCQAFYIIQKNPVDPTALEQSKKFFYKKLREEMALKLEQEWFEREIARREDYLQFSF